MKSKKSIFEARADEQLRQERDAFDQHKRRDQRWFLIRQLIVGISVATMLGILATAIWVLTHPEYFQQLTIFTAGSAVFVQILGAMIFVWKTILSPSSNEHVRPLTIAGSQRATEEVKMPNRNSGRSN